MAGPPAPGDHPPDAAAAAARTGPLRVLLVEDEALVAMMLEDVLADAGHRVVVAHDRAAAEAAWAAAEAAGEPFAALVADLGLPGEPFGGIDLIRGLRAGRHPRPLPVVVVTGYQMTEAELRRRLGRGRRGAAEPTALFVKPFDPAGLLAALARVVAAAGGQHGAAP